HTSAPAVRCECGQAGLFHLEESTTTRRATRRWLAAHLFWVTAIPSRLAPYAGGRHVGMHKGGGSPSSVGGSRPFLPAGGPLPSRLSPGKGNGRGEGRLEADHATLMLRPSLPVPIPVAAPMPSASSRCALRSSPA